MVLANNFPVEIEFFHSKTRTYIMESFHRQLAFGMEFIGIWKNLFHWPFICSVLASVCMTFKLFIITGLIQNNSNYVAVLVFTCWAPSISLRVVDSLRHTHAFSRVTLRVFLVKWATMAVPIIGEYLRFKIKFLIYEILTKKTWYNILSSMVCWN